MRHVLTFFVSILIVIHLYFFTVEAVLWESDPETRHRLGFNRDDPKEVAEVAKVAKNQGVSNALLASGLAWGLWGWRRGTPIGYPVLACFLIFIAIAGLVGYATIRPTDPIATGGFLVGQTGLAVLGLLCLRLTKAPAN